MANVKELRLKIKSLTNTNKITSAMKLVASSKLKKAQEVQGKNRPYNEKLNEVLARISGTGDLDNPLFEVREEKRVRYYVFSSDKGLCGGFNNSIIKFLGLQQAKHKGEQEIFTLGRKANVFFSKRPETGYKKNFADITAKPAFEKVRTVAEEAIRDFQDGKVDAIYLVYNRFESVLTQVPQCQRVLPVSPPVPEETSGFSMDYIFEPEASELLESLLPKYVAMGFFTALLENSAGEHGARMTAMENATTNSKELIEKFSIQMNRARQAAITTELTEIVAGAESI